MENKDYIEMYFNTKDLNEFVRKFWKIDENLNVATLVRKYSYIRTLYKGYDIREFTEMERHILVDLLKFHKGKIQFNKLKKYLPAHKVEMMKKSMEVKNNESK